MLLNSRADTIAARQPIILDAHRHEYVVSSTDQEVSRDEPDVARVGTVVAIVTKEKIASFRHNYWAKVAPGSLGKELHCAFVALYSLVCSYRGGRATVIGRSATRVRLRYSEAVPLM